MFGLMVEGNGELFEVRGSEFGVQVKP